MRLKEKKPKVSILCITYNHAHFIQQALDSFLMQDTDFTFEILIHDDASTDGTDRIIKEYAARHPDIIKPVYEDKNQYSTGNFNFIWNMYKVARGEYIATCEGDDYWTDRNKLQLQVNYLEKNKKSSLCFHPARVVYEKNEEAQSIFPESANANDFTVANLLESNYIQTSSVMYRKKNSYEDAFVDAMPGDWYTHLYHAEYDKIGFIHRPMSAYRRHEGGVWWGARDKKDEFWIKYGIAHLDTYDAIRKLYGNRHAKALNESVSRIFDAIFSVKETALAEEIMILAVNNYPYLIKGAYLARMQRFNDTQVYMQKQEKDVMALHDNIRQKDDYIHNLESQLKEIYDTRLWQLMSRTSRYVHKIWIKK